LEIIYNKTRIVQTIGTSINILWILLPDSDVMIKAVCRDVWGIRTMAAAVDRGYWIVLTLSSWFINYK
jgi:hypothetical protein